MKKILGTIVSIVVALWFVACSMNPIGHETPEQDVSANASEYSSYAALGKRVQAALPQLDAPGDRSEIYFFNNSQYMLLSHRYDPNKKPSFFPGVLPSLGDNIMVTKPTSLHAWASIKKAGFNHVDAFLTSPYGYSLRAAPAYVFSGDQYARIEYAHGGSDKLRWGPRKIAEGLPSLAKHGISHVDATYSYDNGVAKGYLFSNDQFLQVSFRFVDEDFKVTDPPQKITDRWPALAQAGFNTVDEIVKIKGYPNKSDPYHRAYVFSGDNYITIKFMPEDPSTSQLLDAPLDISNGWLHFLADFDQRIVKAALGEIDGPHLGSKSTYFFGYHGKYKRLKGVDDSMNFSVLSEGSISACWPSLKASGLTEPDAFLSVNNYRAYVFQGDQYAEISFNMGGSDSLISGPHSIYSRWPRLKDIGFDHIDAAVPIKQGTRSWTTSEAYFFSGDRYTRVSISKYPNNAVRDASPISDWATLKKAGFKTVDAALSVKGFPRPIRPWHRTYFFSGDKYIQIRFDPDSGKEELLGDYNNNPENWLLPILKNWTPLKDL